MYTYGSQATSGLQQIVTGLMTNEEKRKNYFLLTNSAYVNSIYHSNTTKSCFKTTPTDAWLKKSCASLF